jgi:hypothetical protein
MRTSPFSAVLTLCLRAAGLDWSEIDPSIFGTLFVRGLGPGKRSETGAEPSRLSLHAAGAYQLRRRREAAIERDRALRTFVRDRLAEGWTPEQISGWLK